MASASVTIDDAEILQWVGRLRAAGSRLGPIFAVIAELLVARVQEEFESEGHGKWPPLAKSTLARRRKHGRGAKILQDKGLLAASIEAYSGDDYAEAATDKAYAVFHVSDAPRSIIPLRNFFDVPDEAFDEARDVLLQGILGEKVRR